MNNVKSLKDLYVALVANATDVADVSTIVGMLNAICALYGGTAVATSNADAISNIAAVVTPINIDNPDTPDNP